MSKQPVTSVRLDEKTRAQLDGLREHYRSRFAFNPPITNKALLTLAINRLHKAEVTGRGDHAYEEPVRAFASD